MQPSLFNQDGKSAAKPSHDQPRRLRVMITVTAAPQPSSTYGETVCVAGIRLDLAAPGWIRLYPINLRHLGEDKRFRKYDIVSVEAVPSRQDRRHESWRPRLDTLVVEQRLPPWRRRQSHVEPLLRASMCEVLHEVRTSPPAQSLAAFRPSRVIGLDVERHPGWSPAEQSKINRYVNELELFGEPKSALEAPRFRAWYRYRCANSRCTGHRQGVLDWEFVALQRHLTDRDDTSATQALRQRFLTEMCAPSRDVIFFVGNQAKHERTFSVLGVFYPPR